jgi:hypothetical protein
MHSTPIPKMIRVGSKQPQHCSEFSRLRSQTERVWSSWRDGDDPEHFSNFVYEVNTFLTAASLLDRCAGN